MRSSSGKIRRRDATAVKPPRPESNTPMGRISIPGFAPFEGPDAPFTHSHTKLYIILCLFHPCKTDFSLFTRFFMWHFPGSFAIIMSTESTAMRLIRAAAAAQFYKTACSGRFIKFSHCCNAYFRWCVETHQRKVQGFSGISSKNLALEQLSLIHI